MSRPRWMGVGIGFGCGAAMILCVAAMLVLRPSASKQLRYQLTSDGLGEPELTMALPTSVPSASATPLRIAVVGDVGTGGPAEYRTAEAIDALEGSSEYEALLMLGDNVYPNGDPAALKRVVFDPFVDVLDGGTRLLAVLGNHDVRNDNGDAHAAAIGMPGRWYATEIEDVLVISLDSTQPSNAEQQAWLEATLEATNANWIIATMHHPPYSGGYHGSSLDVREAFTPLFERFGVQLVLAGHDHDYQRSRPIEGVTYIVSGGASKLRPANRAEFTEVAWSTHHFVDLVIWPDRIEVRAVTQTGEMFDSVIVERS